MMGFLSNLYSTYCPAVSVSVQMSSCWSQAALKLVHRLNSFPRKVQGLEPSCKYFPFLVDGVRVGTVPLSVLPHLTDYPGVFSVIKNSNGDIDHVAIASEHKTFEDRTANVDYVMQEFRKKDLFKTLRGWRNEMYAVSSSFSSKPVFMMERAATCLLGITQYGVHLNGYVHNDTGVSMWVGRRSLSKQTFPGKLDNIVAGGISCGTGITETLLKECAEEASMPENIAKLAKPCGTVSYFYEDERGLFPELQFVYDICLPKDFKPIPNDNEVSEFYCWPLDKVKEAIVTSEFKPNCALVVLDFLIRHGHIDPDNEPFYVDFVQGCHQTAGSS